MKYFLLFLKKLLRYLLKPLSFLPALLMMYLIFNFSAQSGDVSGQLSGSVTTELVELCGDLLDRGLERATGSSLCRPAGTLCAKGGSRDGILPAGSHRGLSALGVPAARLEAGAVRRAFLHGLCRPGRMASVLRSRKKPCPARRFYRYRRQPGPASMLPGWSAGSGAGPCSVLFPQRRTGRPTPHPLPVPFCESLQFVRMTHS